MSRFCEYIDKQIAFNKGKNLFLDESESQLKFIQETLYSIGKMDCIDLAAENLLIDYASDKAMQEFCRVNQYYTFNQQAKRDLRAIYVELFANIRNHTNSIEIIAKNHYQNLTQWLQKTNPFAKKIYSTGNKVIDPVACSEYSVDLQIQIFQIDIAQSMEPVLDIGCGKQGDLVQYLRQNNLEAYGFDRFALDMPYLTNADWLDYDYGIEKWGTITSNLGFSNHFRHNHLRDDGSFIDYAGKYMAILHSLKVGGCFYYSPDLPFIEQYLDVNKYGLTRQNIGKYDFKSVKIRRLK